MPKKSPNEFVQIGQIVGVWGLKGHVKVDPVTDFTARFENNTRLRVNSDWVEVQDVRWQKGRPYLKLEGIDTPEAAEKLKWAYVEAPAEDLDLEDDEFLTEDLIGLRVETQSGEVLGKVDQVLVMPAHDVLLVGEIMIPAVKQFILDVDTEGGMVLVELIPGMRPGEE